MTGMRLLVASGVCALSLQFGACVVRAQIPLAETFEVSSVKINTQLDGPRGIVVDPGRFTATGALLSDLRASSLD